MTGAWFAVEDIKPGAGRFFVYPKSHLFDMAKNGGDVDVAFNHARYKDLVKRVIKVQGCRGIKGCVIPLSRSNTIWMR